MTPVEPFRGVAEAALRFVRPGAVIGVGTGRTASAFIEALSASDRRPAAAVASSETSADLLRAAGIPVTDLPADGRLPLYVDGADSVDAAFRLLKGAGGAHAREKVLAAASDLFVCVADASKPAASLRGLPVVVEVLPMARALVVRELSALGGESTPRARFTTDNGNDVLDVRGLDLNDAVAMERALELIPGVVACGIFAIRPADVLLVGRADGSVEEHRREA